MKSLQLVVAGIVASALCGICLYAGGPMGANGTTAIKYSSGSITYKYDQGTLGFFSNAQAHSYTSYGFAQWDNVSSASLAFTDGGNLGRDVTVYTDAYISGGSQFSDGVNPMVFDNNGSITDSVIGVGAKTSVLGFAASAYSVVTYQYVEGYSIINGYLATTASDSTTYKQVLAHEFGHFLGLAHPQNTIRGVFATMYPISTNAAQQVTLTPDDTSAIANLYPTAGYTSSVGAISGTVKKPNGTNLSGVNVIAEDSATGACYSSVVDYYNGGSGQFYNVPSVSGSYTISGLPPGKYFLKIEPIGSLFSAFTGGSSIASYSSGAPAATTTLVREWYNGYNESGDHLTDNTNERSPVSVSAGTTTSGINFTSNESSTTTLTEVSYYYPSGSIYLYTLPASASRMGVRFTAPSNGSLVGFNIDLYSATSLTNGGTVAVSVHANQGGSPGTLLGSVLIPSNEISADQTDFIWLRSLGSSVNFNSGEDFFVVVSQPSSGTLAFLADSATVGTRGVLYSGGWSSFTRNALVSAVYSSGSANSYRSSSMTTANHSFEVQKGGALFAYGDNSSGQLGDNTTTQKSTPTFVVKGQYSGTTYLGDNTANPVTIASAGYRHSVALASVNSVYAWGDNSTGQLGTNNATSSSTPMRVLMGQYSGTTYLDDNTGNKVVAISAGNDFSFALAQDGLVYAWGADGNGQLGNAATSTSSIPVKVRAGAGGTTYLGDGASNKVIATSAGEFHGSALLQDGIVYTWGLNTSGQLGDNTNTQRTTPVKVLKGVYPGTNYLGDITTNRVVAIASGGSFTLALTQDGSVYGWGANGNGQLGNSSLTSTSTPVRVQKGQYAGTTYLGDATANRVLDISAGLTHSLSLTADGTVYCWGNNADGQLGNGTITQSTTPVRMLSGQYTGTGSTYFGDIASDPAQLLSGGRNHSVMVIGDAGLTMYAVGDNGFGQLGDCSVTDKSTPVRARSCTGDMGLPIELTDFTAKLVDATVRLNWETASELNNYGFVVERSVSDNTLPGMWNDVQFRVGRGTSNLPSHYRYDDNVSSLLTDGKRVVVSYRLRQIDLDGSIHYSGVRQVLVDPNGAATGERTWLGANVPNPFSTSSEFEYSVGESGNVHIELKDAMGRSVQVLVDGFVKAGVHSFTLYAADLPVGVYYCELVMGSNRMVRGITVVK